MQQKENKDSIFIMDYLEEIFPNKLPLDEITSYELGILIGQQLLIDKLKLKLKYTEKERLEDR